MESLGIIAGNGEFPLVLARAARQQGITRIVAAAFDGETKPEVRSVVDEIEWVKLGQLNKLIEAFTSRGVKRAVMAGGITPSNLFKNLRLDFRMTSVAFRLKERNAETIFGAIAEELAKDGVELVDPRPFLGEAVPKPGVLTRQKPSKEQLADVEFGWKIAKGVSLLDIGQTVVVRKGTVLAVEAFEGTDECIRRGGALAGNDGGAIVVKVSKPNHDFRFDIPCVGENTIESSRVGQISLMAIEAGRCLLLNKENVVETANKFGLCILAVEAAPRGFRQAMSETIKLGVVGVGQLGSHHARIYSELAKRSNGLCTFIGIFDTDRIRLRALTEKYGGGAFESAQELAGFCDAVSVATPTETHYDVARVFLEQGKHVLVEKPITDSLQQAGELVALARKKKCVLQVGHVERFNPVMRYLNEVLREARFIEVHRLSPYPGRSTDIGVVLDLMIHDIDVVLSLVKAPLAKVDAVGIPVLSEKEEDIANARLKFANGCVANITASRVSAERMRKIRIFGRTEHGAAYISLDYMNQVGELYRVASGDAQESGLLKKLLAGKHASIVSEFAGRKIVREPLPIERDEPLKLELQHFIDAVRHHRDPLVTGEAAQQALEVAMEITEQVRRG